MSGLGFEETIRLANYSSTAELLSGHRGVTVSFRKTVSFGPFSSPVRSSQYHALYYPGTQHRQEYKEE